jgi:DNA (cytosine-5)-methyltransferase 1
MIPHPGSDIPGVIAPWIGKPADYKLIVDFFAGGGGASKGIELALGRSPDIAVNHDEEAIALHRANHPNTIHLQKDIWSVMPELVRLIGNRRVGLFHASPDCKHFSKAKGGKPVKRAIRDLAWVVPQFAKRFRPEVITLENVEEFAGWGPLVQKADDNGHLMFDEEGRPLMVPCKKRKGETFMQWVAALQRLGYKVKWKEMRASDHGAPTIRKRMFVVARCDGEDIVFPEPSHGDPRRPEFKAKKLKKWRTAAEIIDWSRPCHSIFLTKEEGRAVGVRRPLVGKTEARIAKGIFRFVLNNPQPYIVNLTHQGGDRLETLEEPLRTVTGAHRGEKAIVIPTITKFNTGASDTANSFIERPGGAAPLGLVEATVVGPFVAGVGGRMGQTEARGAEDPLQTITSKADSVLVTPYLARTAHGDVDKKGKRRGKGEHSLKEPMSSVLASPDHALIAPTLIQSGYGEREGQEPRAPGLDKPLGTAVAGGVKHAVIAPHLMTMRDAQKPFNEADKPTHTVTAGGARLHLVAAFMAKHFGGHETPGGSVGEPISTVTAKDHHALVSAGLVNLRGTAEDQISARSVEAPTPTASAGGRHQAAVTAFLTKYHGTGGQHAQVENPLPTVDCNDRLALITVMIDGEPWIIVDIGMRMLTARELFAAQGFTSDYIIDKGLFVAKNGEWKWRTLTSTAQVRLCGNSVSPEVEFALIAANCSHLDAKKKRRVA